MSEHPDSDQLALLAMQSDVDDSVRQHLATCTECQRDVALLASLLAADGPDGGSAESSHGAAEPSPPVDAWVDGNDTTAADHPLTPAGYDEPLTPEPPPATGTPREINYVALVFVVLIVLVSIALAVFFLR